MTAPAHLWPVMPSMREWAQDHGIPQACKPTEEEDDEPYFNEDFIINPES